MNCYVCGAGPDNTTIHIQAAGFRLVRCRGCCMVYRPESPVSSTDPYGKEYFTGTLEEERFPGETFDVVVPNIESIMARLLGARWYSLKPDEHVWHFSPATLARLMGQNGLDVIRWESRENNRPSGGVAKRFLQTAINAVAVLTNRSEAMLLFARRDHRGDS